MGEEVNSPKPEDEDDMSHLFTVDNNPTHISDDLDIPVYSSKFNILKEKVEGQKEETTNPKASKPPGISCWNCGGNHNLRDCTEKHDYAVIAQKRAANQARYSKGRVSSRYHTDEEQRFAHLCPGKLSQALRDALGLRPEQIPAHVYRMRQLGYPPGWVEEAKISHSGLSMFDSQGQEVKDPDLEDGEIVSKEDREKYDTRKLIEYPGFNVPFETGTIDETDVYGAFPMREIQSIKHMLRLWSGKKIGAYKRRKLPTTPSVPPGNSSPAANPQAVAVEHQDMEVDPEEEGELRFVPPTDNCRFIPPLPDSTPTKPPPPPPPTPEGTPAATPEGMPAATPEGTPAATPEGMPAATPEGTPAATPEGTPAATPTATGVKRKLSTNEDECSAATIRKLETSTDEQLQDSSAEECSDTTGVKDISSPSPAAEPFNGRVKSVCSGTPVITRSEFKYLPCPENFSKDICDVINFENLPNATGKYEQMRGLVQKVRDYVSLSIMKSDESDNDE